MQVEDRRIADVLPYPGNPRLNDHAVDSIAESIRQFGFRQPIVVDREGVIVAGHARWKAAKKLGLEVVPVHVATELTDAQVRAYRIADNKLAELADWDVDLLPGELDALRALDIDLALLGFDAAELESLLGAGIHGSEGLVDPDLIPKPPAEAVTKRGNLWILGDHRLLCGDSSKPEDLDRLLAGARIHLVNSDPPYNVNVEPRSKAAVAAGLTTFGADKAGKPDEGMQLRAKDRPLANDFVSEEDFTRLLHAWFANATRALEPGRSFYFWGGYTNIANYPPALAANGLHLAQTIIWVKEHPVLTRKDFMGNHEWAFYGWKEGAAHYFNPTMRDVPDVWRMARAEQGTVALGRGVNLVAPDGSRVAVCPPSTKLRDVQVGESVDVYGAGPATDVWMVKKVPPQAMVHLTEKPVELAVRAMTYSSRPGEHVLDLFGGSGSTLIAAQQCGRRAFLMELDPLYCDVIVQRFEQFTGRKAEIAV